MKKEEWGCDFANYALFHDIAFALTPLLYGASRHGGEDWPDLDDYQFYLDSQINPVQLGQITRLKSVAQDVRPKTFSQSYLARVYLQGEIQTRLCNWHDFMQILSWRLFPLSKSALVERHFFCAEQRWRDLDRGAVEPGRRSQQENLLSLWDEGGLLIVSDSDEIAQMLRQFQWRELFVAYRHQLRDHLRVIVFGHGLFEKLRHPYIGLTANSVILAVETQQMALSTQALLPIVDAQLAQLIKQPSRNDNTLASNMATPFTHALNNPRDLQPFPLLGMPGLWPGNDTPAFYENERYFRPGRREHQAVMKLNV